LISAILLPLIVTHTAPTNLHLFTPSRWAIQKVSNAPDNDLLHPTTFEKASVGGVLLDIGCVALFSRILDVVISF
jgi:hypothetical protein